ncbi:hypothetical protein Sme01_59050 [Sphaerisporangium melleum]|uniref:Uncharacterized protein n=1 Tax=Sphaerisporangium melleum TaxID=321316 RepID=A0A917R7H3_9ACTN|nr:DUF6716 putative glycosyltransferase [Sphaerisporangium melleum]GGK93271.1 hypothetical protein GCM10007964_39700 [Sphaerisporangium melleum]GII73429.1 hypothetical protein Sme01_59050 [Sphaerisporangium melleum]
MSRVLAVADSDSYLKWAAGLLDQLPAGWTSTLTVVRTPIVPSQAQIAAAVSGTRAGAGEPPAVVAARALRRMAERDRPDAILLACTGPVVDVLAGGVLEGLRPRPVLVSGLPGISIPATEKAWLYRGGCDLFVVHSGREVEEFGRIGKELGASGAMALARLPYLDHLDAFGGTGNRLVFATQAKVPKRRDDRESILLALARLAESRPGLDVVVKLRALENERQTHNERYHYERLWRALAESGQVRPDAVRFAAGPMREHLAAAAGFVTVSSTAALEAIAGRVPLLVLSDFGVSAEMINLVFEDSGCLGTLDDLARGDLRRPTAAWCEANYFHDPATGDWVAKLDALVAQARAGTLAPVRSLLDGPEHAAARRKARLRVEVPPNVLRAGYRASRRVRRYLKALG